MPTSSPPSIATQPELASPDSAPAAVKPRSALRRWLRRLIESSITIAIFVWISRTISQNWNQVKDHVYAISWWRLLLASVMFALFLFVFRALAWRRILQGFGHELPVAPALRIWTTSELARYLPGVIWQVVGRAYLVKPYGVSATICSTSQVLELVIFLLANVLMAISCLLWNKSKQVTGPAHLWLLGALTLVPILLLILHPRIFYGLMNGILRRLKKPEITRQLSFGLLAGLLLWNVLGLFWQSLAIWILTAGPLDLQLAKWWVVAGAYSLAWCAGFLAVWAPGGIGVRELVFMTAMHYVVPRRVRQHFHTQAALDGFLAFLCVLLRLWATSGELLVAGVAYAMDMKGALGHADAEGRIGK